MVLRGEVVPVFVVALRGVSRAAMDGVPASNMVEPLMGGLNVVVGNPNQEDLAGRAESALRGVTGFKKRSVIVKR